MTKQMKQAEADNPASMELSDSDLEAIAGAGFTGGVRVAAGDVNGDASTLDDGAIPTETLSLNFDKITWK